MSISALVGQIPKMPTAAVRLLRLLNRFGAVRLGVDEVGFDGDGIAWSKVAQVRTHRLSDVLSWSLLEVEVERLSRPLPPVPGRRWMLSRVGELLLTLAQMGTGISDADQPEPAEGTGEADDPRVAVEIVHGGMVRQEVHHRAGLTAALLLAAMPEANRALVTLAEQRDIPVVATEEKGVWDAAGDRAESMRSTIAAMRSRFTRTSKELEAP